MNVNDLEKYILFVCTLTVVSFLTMALTNITIFARILEFIGFFCVGMLIAMNYFYYMMTRKNRYKRYKRKELI